MPSAESFGEEAMALMAAEMKQKHKEVHKKVIHKGHAQQVPTMPTMPAMPMSMMPMMQMPAMPTVPTIPTMPAVPVVEDEVVEEEIIVEEQAAEHLESLRQIWDVKIAQRDGQWQAVIQEMQARMAVLSMHTHSKDSSFECEIARYKQQIENLEATVGVLEEDKAESHRIHVELKSKWECCEGRYTNLEKLYKQVTDDYTKLKRDYDSVHESKLELYKTVNEKKDFVKWSIDAEHEAIRKTNIELSTRASNMEAEIDGDRVHIERLQGIISLLQVKLAERDDARVQEAFSQEIVFAESTKSRVIVEDTVTVSGSGISDLEIEARIASQVMERVRIETYETEMKVAKKEKQILELRAELDKVKIIEDKYKLELQRLRDEHLLELERVKESYRYLDTVIRVDPSAYEYRHSRTRSPRGGARIEPATVLLGRSPPTETISANLSAATAETVRTTVETTSAAAERRRR